MKNNFYVDISVNFITSLQIWKKNRLKILKMSIIVVELHNLYAKIQCPVTIDNTKAFNLVIRELYYYDHIPDKNRTSAIQFLRFILWCHCNFKDITKCRRMSTMSNHSPKNQMSGKKTRKKYREYKENTCMREIKCRYCRWRKRRKLRIKG